MELSSSAFATGQPIPRRYSCAGEDLSPPLEWREVPADAISLALIVDDPDAPYGRILRGGSWGNVARNVRAASRDRLDPGDRYDRLGFRCARVQA